MRPTPFSIAVPFLACLAWIPHANGYATFIRAAKNRLQYNSTDSWVSGARTEALLELDFPTLSVFAQNSIPQPASPVPTSPNYIVAQWAAVRPSNADEFIEVEGGAAGDPASVGVAWIMAQLAAKSTVKARYKVIIEQELHYLLSVVPRTSDGAISTRPPSEPVQLWSDFIYMVPPFLAYYGAVNRNITVLKEAYKQCSLYRTHLRDPTTGLWMHVRYGDWTDLSLWGTGNAWAAAGMLRVLATIDRSAYAGSFAIERRNLIAWINEILDGTFARFSAKEALLPNSYSMKSTFFDASSSALLAATALRFAQQGYPSTSSTRLATAAKLRASVNRRVNKTTGWLTPVVDPYNARSQTTQSPESCAFVLILAAAGMDYDKSLL